MARLSARLLGTLEVCLDERPVAAFEYDKVRALLAYLIVESDRPHRREWLAGLLWPESAERAARQSLSQALLVLRRAIADGEATPPFLLITMHTLQWNAAGDSWLDVAELTSLIDAVQQHPHAELVTCDHCLAQLERAAALYGGDFLAGFSLPDCPEFEIWLTLQRERLQQIALETLDQLTRAHLQCDEFEIALDYAQRQLTLDRWREPAYRQAMTALARSGQRGAALRQYRECMRVLEVELGVAPSAQTQATYKRLLADEARAAGESAAAQPTEQTPRSVGPCPYRGLAAFREIDAEIYFGREDFVDRLEAALTAGGGITAVVGPSGSGKSSLVAAGLVPRLRATGAWKIVTLRPARRPFQSLAEGLIPLLEPEMTATARLVERRRLGKALRTGEVTLRAVCAAIGESSDNQRRLLLVIDQFEEVYTLCPDGEVQKAFVEGLLSAAAPRKARQYGRVSACVLLTLRADFMGQALGQRDIADAIQTGIQVLGPMTREELQAAIEKPAASQGAAFDAGLVDRLLGDVEGAPGNLPLLEFALTLLWERLDYGWLTHGAYEAIGQVGGALAQYAEEEYAALTAEDQALARHILVQLVQPGAGTEDIRRVATRAELGVAGWDLVQHLADRRLVVTGRDAGSSAETVEVVHEALIGHWERLQAWMAEDRTFRTWQERLRIGAETWLRTDRDEGALLRGGLLAEAGRWLEIRRTDLGVDELAFIEASVALRERREAEREAQLERERQLNEQALRQAAIGLAAEARLQMQGPNPDRAALLALEALEHYPYTWQAERALADIVLNWRLVRRLPHSAMIHSRPEISPDGTRLLTADSSGWLRICDIESGGNLLAVQAYEGRVAAHHWAHWSPDGRRILSHTLDGGRPRIWDTETGERVLELPSDEGCFVEWSPNGKQILSYWCDRTATIWDAQTGKETHTLSGNERQSAHFSPDGSKIVTGTGQVWGAISGELIRTLAGFQTSARRGTPITWSRDGTLIGSGPQGVARVWSAETGDEVWRLPATFANEVKLWWSPDDTRVLALDAIFTKDLDAAAAPAILWNVATGEEIARLPTSSRVNWGLDPWARNGKMLLLPDVRGHATLWDGVTGELRVDLVAHEEDAEANWLPDGRGFVTTSRDSLAKIWRVSAAEATLRPSPDLPPNTNDMYDIVAWAPDGKRVARDLDDGSLWVWDVASKAALCHTSWSTTELPVVVHLAWSPDGGRIMTTHFGTDGRVRVWDVFAGDLELALERPHSYVHTVAWSPDGKRALSCGQDGVARVWDADTGTALLQITGQVFFSGAWSPDGTRIVLADLTSYRGPVRIWNATTGEPLLTLLADDFQYGTPGVAWSSDGLRIVTFSLDKVGRLWDADSGELLGTFPASNTGWLPEWSPSDRRIIASGLGGPPRVWDATTLEEVARYPGGKTGTWAPDGSAVAVGCANGEIKIYPAWESTEDLIAYAKAHCVLRELTAEERARYGLAAQYGLPER